MPRSATLLNFIIEIPSSRVAVTDRTVCERLTEASAFSSRNKSNSGIRAKAMTTLRGPAASDRLRVHVRPLDYNRHQRTGSTFTTPPRSPATGAQIQILRSQFGRITASRGPPQCGPRQPAQSTVAGFVEDRGRSATGCNSSGLRYEQEARPALIPDFSLNRIGLHESAPTWDATGTRTHEGVTAATDGT